MPEITTPSMPVISTPKVSNSMHPTNTNNKTNSNTQNKAKSIKNEGLSALALMGLSGSGDLGKISSLLEQSSNSDLSALSSLTSTTATSTNNSTNILLAQILEKLTKLTESKPNNVAPLPTNNSSHPEQQFVLRCRGNNSDILSTIKNVYISNPENNGSFFLTGDRIYTADGKQRTETFYMMFCSQNADTQFLNNYKVAISVLQDSTNLNSFFYQLSKLSPVTAQKTGNLASIRVDTQNFKFDFLVNLNN